MQPSASFVTFDSQHTDLVWLNLRSLFGWMHISHLPEDEHLVWLACGLNVTDMCMVCGKTCACYVAGHVHPTWHVDVMWQTCAPHMAGM